MSESGQKTPPPGTGESINTSGEENAKSEAEPGGVDQGTHPESGRPAGGSTQRKKTGIDPQEPIDPESPNLTGP